MLPNSQCRIVPNLAHAAFLLLAAGLAGQSPDPDWSWLSLGEGAGVPQVLCSPVGGTMEIVVPCSGTFPAWSARYWIILRRNAGANDYEEVFASPVRPDSDAIVRLGTWVTGTSPTPKVVVMTRGGNVEIWDQAARTRSSTFFIGAADMNSGHLFDLDRDGTLDVVMAGANGLRAARLDGTAILAMSGIDGIAITAGQMDGDPSIEIATTSGDVVDVDSQTVQFHWQNRFGVALVASDIDGDGKDELIVAQDQSWLWAWDIDLQLPKWSHYVFDLDCLVLANIDADPQIEIVVGGGQSTGILAFDPLTLAEDLRIPQQGSGTASLAIADVDGDGQTEVLWVTNYNSTAADKVVVADLATQAIEWSSTEIAPRSVGPVVGDVDGDGIAEAVFVTGRGVFTVPRIMIVDPVTHRLRFSALVPLGNQDVTDVDLVDVDGDGDMEIAIVDGTFKVLDFAAGQLTMLWRLTTPALAGSCRHAEVADVDGDGNLEAMLTMNGTIQVFDYGATSELWRGPVVGESVQLEIAQMDGDPGLEIVVLQQDGDLRIFDAATHLLQAQLADGGVDWTAFSLLPTNVPGAPLQHPGLVVGNVSGGVSVLIDSGSGLLTLGPFPVATARIDGIRWVDGSTLFVFGAGGRLQINDLLAPLWRSNDYGLGFGRRVVLDLANLRLATAGLYGLSYFQF